MKINIFLLFITLSLGLIFPLKVQGLQEIHVVGNGNAILDGQAVPSANNYTDMGDLLVPAGSQIERTYYIVNVGNAPLIINPISKPRSEAGADIGFSIVQQPANVVGNGGFTFFKLRFDPFSDTVGSYVAYLFITNSDPDEAIYNFTIKADVISPEIRVKGNSIFNIPDNSVNTALLNGTDFGSTAWEGNIDRVFIIENIGNAPLFLGAVQVLNDVGSAFEVIDSPDWWVAAGTNTTMTVRFTPTVWGPANQFADISFDTSDSDEDPFNFRIKARGLNSHMAVLGNNIIITNASNYGYGAPSINNNTDFSSVPLGGYIERIFEIHNFIGLYGNEDLAITTNVADPANGFSITLQPNALVVPGDTTEMIVRFEPVAMGYATSVVTIVSSDLDDNPYTFNIRGHAAPASVEAPEINVAGNGQNIANGATTSSVTDHTTFVDTTIGETTFRTYAIENVSEGDNFLSVSIVADPGKGFTVSQQPFTPIEASSGSSLTIAFTPDAVGVYSTVVTIVNDDPNENPYSFTIQGRGVEP